MFGLGVTSGSCGLLLLLCCHGNGHMLDSGWADPNAIGDVLAEQRSQDRVTEEGRVADGVYPLWVHHHGNNLCNSEHMCVRCASRMTEVDSKELERKWKG